MDILELQNRNQHATHRHPWELARVEIAIQKLRKLIGNTSPANINIVDIGCGDLFVLETIGKAIPFRTLLGIDPALPMEEINRLNDHYRNTNIQVLHSLDAVQVAEGTMSIILLLDVVEHIEDDHAFLADLRRRPFVTPETKMLLTVPSFQTLFCSHDVFLLHFRRYTSKKTSNVIENAGFQTLERGYFFTSLLFPRLLVVAKERLLKPKNAPTPTGLATWQGGAFLTHLIKNILLLDYFILSMFLKIGIKIPGLSNFVTAKVK